ncbi:MAG: carboxypeptidase regulatory-like domain-containing protein [Polyangiales bacterium]
MKFNIHAALMMALFVAAAPVRAQSGDDQGGLRQPVWERDEDVTEPSAPSDAHEEAPAPERTKEPDQESPSQAPSNEPSSEQDAGAADTPSESVSEASADDGNDDEGDSVDEEYEDMEVSYGDTPENDVKNDAKLDENGMPVDYVPPPPGGANAIVQQPGKPVSLEPGADATTGIEGRVGSRKTKRTLADAPVTATGKNDKKVRATITDASGRYRLLLPPGTYTVRSYYDLYHGARWDEIVVARGKFRKVNFVLDPISEKDAGVEELEVAYLADTSSEAAQLSMRKEAVTTQDAISAEEISRSGDGSTEGAVKRVVGVTIDEDGRIVIRGLGTRYNRILLNGVDIPGVEPDMPSIKLDIFPTDIVSNLAVAKTARPDLPGDFAGGALQIETASFPLKLEINAGVSLGVNSNATFQQVPTYHGGRLDFLGFDDGTRQLPSTVGDNRLAISRNGPYQSFDDLTPIANSFPNYWSRHYKTAIPKLGLNASVGNTINASDKIKLGYQAAVLYDYDQKERDGYNRIYVFDEKGDNVRPLSDFNYKNGTEEIQWGTFGSGYAQINRDHRITAVSLFSRASTDKTIYQLGITENSAVETTKDSFDFTGRSIFFNQLMGDHQNLTRKALRFRWSLFMSTGKRSVPDRRQVQQQVETRTVPLATRFYSNLDQISYGGKLSLRVPLWQQAYLTFGGRVSQLQRDYSIRRFAYERGGDAACW